MRLNNKVAVVTGAGQGMGRAIAEVLAAEGARVVAVDLQLSAVRDTVASLASPEQSLAINCDITDSKAVKALFEQVETELGPVDVLVNNAGIGQAPGDGFDKFQERLGERMAQMAAGETPTVFADHTIDMGDDGWLKVVDVNLNGSFYCSREALRMMTRNNTKGSIINISSTSAYTGEGGCHYAASKAALLGLTHALAEEVGPRGIRVNAVVPGPTLTPAMMTISQEWRDSMAQNMLLKRLAEPEEIARSVLFLASDDASMVTGQALCANGGSYML